MLVEAQQVAQVLGGEATLGTTQQDLERVVQQGLPGELASVIINYIYPHDPEQQYKLVPRSTLNRQLKANKPLSAEDSQRLERVARVYTIADQVWGDPTDARAFMTTPHPMLDNRTPFEASLTELGARQVEDILGRLLFGSAA